MFESLKRPCSCGRMRFAVDPLSRFMEHCRDLNYWKTHGGESGRDAL